MKSDKDVRQEKADDGTAEAYAPPTAEDIEVVESPAVTAAGIVTVPVSDRALKEQFTDVDVSEVLERVSSIPISRWSYRDEPSVRHIGPMAQDFAAAFSVGRDDRHIHTVDASGVALASIQALRQLVERQAEEIRALRAEIEALRDA